MRELRPGLWHWEAPHPDWELSTPWQQVYGQWLSPGEVSPQVSYYAIDNDKRLLLFDPMDVPSEIEELAADREPVVVLTCPWHERDTRAWWNGSARRCSFPPTRAPPTWPGC